MNAAFSTLTRALSPSWDAYISEQAMVRTSYNTQLKMSHIAGMIAEEMASNVFRGKAGALLHDIGKAVEMKSPERTWKIGKRILQSSAPVKTIIKAMQKPS